MQSPAPTVLFFLSESNDPVLLSTVSLLASLRITAKATRQVEMILWGRYLTMEMFFSMIDKWRPLLSFILSSCPNLEKVTVCLPTAMDFLNGNDDVFIFLNSLDALLHWVILGVLPMLPKSAVFSAKVEYQVHGCISVSLLGKGSDSGSVVSSVFRMSSSILSWIMSQTADSLSPEGKAPFSRCASSPTRGSRSTQLSGQ